MLCVPPTWEWGTRLTAHPDSTPASHVLHSPTHLNRGVSMGKGDRRSRRGKIYRGTYGRTRLKKKRNKTKKAPPEQG